jgi:NAD(P)-dependent dehydrogenase (short-subunit alcohol dehydrogenase family)
MKKLANKVAVLTGATSGMALASARLFVEEGAYVFITGRKQEQLDAAVKSIGHNVTGVVCDSGKLSDLDHLFEVVTKTKGSIDVLFASAGAVGGAPIGQITEEDFDRQFNVNAKGTLFTVQKALPLMNDYASIIMTGSLMALKGGAYSSVYSASKATLDLYAKSWIAELKDRHIRVNVIHPGLIETALYDLLPEERRQSYLSQTVAGRGGKPEEIAATALFLASGDSSYINGISISVDGGSYGVL